MTAPTPDDYVDYDDHMDGGCYECGGEGFVSDCVEEWACIDPEYGCDYCTRRCPLCNSPKRDPAQGTPTRSAETIGSVGEADGGPVAESDAPNLVLHPPQGNV